MDLFLAHSLGLLWISVGTVRRLVSHPADQLLGAVLLAWANLTAAKLFQACIDKSGEPVWLIGSSALLAALLHWMCRRISPTAAPIQANHPGPGLWALLAAGLTMLALSTAVLTADFRTDLGGSSLLHLLAWLPVGLGFYRLGRLGRLSANLSLVFSCLGLAAGFILCPFHWAAVALLPASGILAGSVFAWQWQQHRQHRHALLASLAVLLVAGSLSGQFGWSEPSERIATSTPPTDKHRIFFQDLVILPETGPAITDGLNLAEGPYSKRELPLFRSVRQPTMRIVIPPQTGAARYRLRFSMGLLKRDKTEILIRYNGNSVKRLSLSRRDGWSDETFEFEAHPGENLIEFTDLPHQQVFDWRSYLELYPDVMRYLVTHNIPLEEGAIQHYELNGRQEGRIMRLREVAPPARGAYHFVFRELQVEGLR